MTSNVVIFDAILSGETRPYVFDFISKLQVGEGISVAGVAPTVYSGNDQNPSGILSGSAAISGTQVTQSIACAFAQVGNVYTLLCSVTTNLGNTYELMGYLPVEPVGAG